MQGSIPEKRPAFASALRWATRRSRSGQSIILVAFAMVVLIAFVGIATDVALLFVRYTSLRRAVDSASIAVAGQVRTGVDFAKLNNVARQFVQLQGGVDAETVLVETCETDVHNYKLEYLSVVGSLPVYPGSPDPDARQLDANGNLVAATEFRPETDMILGMSSLYTAVPDRPKTELCKFDPQKLVRVSAQMQSPTVFLSILGWRNVVLTASSVSQTAVLDVALVIDISPSMAEDTIEEQKKYACYTGTCQTFARPSPRFPTVDGDDEDGDGNNDDTAWTTYPYTAPTDRDDTYQNLLVRTNFDALRDFKPLTGDAATMYSFTAPNGSTVTGYGLELTPVPPGGYAITGSGQAYPDQKSIRTECISEMTFLKQSIQYGEFPPVGVPNFTGGNVAGNYGWGGCCNDPTVQTNPPLPLTNPPTEVDYFKLYPSVGYQAGEPPVGFAKNQTKMAYDAKVNPDWYVYDNGYMIESEIAVDGDYYRDSGTYTGAQAATVARSYDVNNMTQTANGDGNFSDLICQPFKQVRDAARRFIKRLDFVRGDRLMLITFYGSPQVVYPSYESSGYSDPFIYDKDDAVRTLNFRVGVVYNWNPPANPGWDSGDPLLASNVPNPNNTSNVPVTGWQQYCRAWQREYNPSNVYTYWSVAQCPDTNTGGGIYLSRSMFSYYGRRDAVWVMVLLSDGEANRTPALPRVIPGVAADPSYGTMVGRPDGSPYRNWLEVPDTWLPSTYPASELDKYCTTLTGDTVLQSHSCVPGDPAAELYFGVDDPLTPGVNETVERCNKYGSRPELCQAWYRSGSFDTEPFSYGFCPWSTFCESSIYNASGQLDPRKVKPECYAVGAADPIFGYTHPNIDPTYGFVVQGSSVPVNDLTGVNEPAQWNPNLVEFGAPFCIDNDPDSRHFCTNPQGYINAYYNKYVPDTTTPNKDDVVPDTSSGLSYCSPEYDADDYARDQADWAGLINYTDTVPGDFIAMFTIFFSKKDATGNERALGQYILGVKLMRYIADAGDNGRIDNNLQEWYRYYRGQADLYGYAASQDVIYARAGYPYAHYRSGDYIANIYTGATWLDPDQDPCAEYDYNEYQLLGGTVRSQYPDGTATAVYETIARQDCGQYWFANDISKVNRAFTEIAGRLFTRLAR
jgi:hypothetical protein